MAPCSRQVNMVSHQGANMRTWFRLGTPRDRSWGPLAKEEESPHRHLHACLSIHDFFVLERKIDSHSIPIRAMFMSVRCLHRTLFFGTRCLQLPTIAPRSTRTFHQPILSDRWHSTWESSNALKRPTHTTSAVGDSEGVEEIEVELPSHCPGCGVRLQLDDENAPGYDVLCACVMTN